MIEIPVTVFGRPRGRDCEVVKLQLYGRRERLQVPDGRIAPHHIWRMGDDAWRWDHTWRRPDNWYQVGDWPYVIWLSDGTFATTRRNYLERPLHLLGARLA